MLTASSFGELMRAKHAMEELKNVKPAVYNQFEHIIHLTRQLQFKFQYMGCLIMNETADLYLPNVKDSYILNVYQKEIDKLKAEEAAADLQQVLASYKQIGYATLSRLVMGENPEVLVGPALIR